MLSALAVYLLSVHKCCKIMITVMNARPKLVQILVDCITVAVARWSFLLLIVNVHKEDIHLQLIVHTVVKFGLNIHCNFNCIWLGSSDAKIGG